MLHTNDNRIRYVLIWQEERSRDSHHFDSHKVYAVADEVPVEDAGETETWYVVEIRPAPEGEPDTLVLARQAPQG